MDIKNKKILSLLIIIMATGIFFRTYNFSEFLRFNPDQARDAALARDVVVGQETWPLLGPQAGGTNFKLGPAFYEFQIVSAKIFGNTPDKVALPDLFFSILAILLLYFFLREFFSRKISLTGAGIMAVSFYAVKYARFAWNPNSTPFYVLLFLYATLQLAKDKTKAKWLWAVLVGVSAGIGVQLHSLLLFSLPIVFVIYFARLFLKKNPAWKWAPFILFVGLLVNTPQIMSEVRTGGKNSQAFFQGMEKKSARSGTLVQKFALDATCHVQTNSFILLPLGNDSECDFVDAVDNFSKNAKGSGGVLANFILLGNIVFAGAFSLGGYFLLFHYYRLEKDEEKKRFLELVILYAGIIFALLVPLAAEISFRFFLVLEFMSFLLLALWLKFAQEKLQPKIAVLVAAIIVATVIGTNVTTLAHNFSYLAGQTKEGRNGFEEITLGEVEYTAKFIQSRSDGVKNIYLDGKPAELFKITKPIQYFTDPIDLDVQDLKKNKVLTAEDKVFLIDVVKDPSGENNRPEKAISDGSFNRVRIYEIEK